MNEHFQEISDDDRLYGRFEIMATSNGFMPYDHDCDEYLYDEQGNNCFDDFADAAQLVEDAALTIREHAND